MTSGRAQRSSPSDRVRLPKRRWAAGAPQLLASFTVYTLIVVAIVVWLAYGRSAWLVALAVAATLAFTAALLTALRRLLGGKDRPLPPGGRIRKRTIALAIVPALIVPPVAAAVVRAESRPQDTPVATVREFLRAAVVDNDGETACSYLTPRARLDFEGASRLNTTCEVFFGGTSLRLGGLAVTSDTDVDSLHYSVADHEGEPIVTVSHGGQAMRFMLRKADSVEREAFLAPPTSWRIDSSVNALAGPTASSGV